MRILVTGAEGFVGTHLVSRLVRDGHEVVALSRHPGRQLASSPNVRPVCGDVVENIGIEPAMAGVDAVIHLVGIILETGRQTFPRVHVIGTRNVLAAARSAGISHFVHMSAAGARRTGVSRYQVTKFQAEEEVRQSGIPYTILRPSLIVGPGDGFVSQMFAVMKSAPLFRPVPGSGAYPFTPIYVEDAVECFARALTQPAAKNQTIDLGGAERITLAEILEKIADRAKIRKLAVKIPLPLMYLGAVFASVLPRPPVTRDQLNMLREGSAVDTEIMRAIFNLNPLSFSAALDLYFAARDEVKHLK